MPADLFDPEPLLSPLEGESPCGPDLEYDTDFQALNDAGAGKPERQYGDKIFPAEPPDWLNVHEKALALAQRTRDLRVAVWLTRSGARLQGMAGALRGLQLVQGLLERHWDLLHPQLDAGDDNDPTMRLNALLPLYDPGAALADLRQASLAPVRGGLTLRDLELGLGRSQPHGEEAQPTEAGVLQGLQELIERHAETASVLTDAAACAHAIADTVQSAVGMRAPEAAPLFELLDTGRVAIAKLSGEGAEESAAEDAAADGDAGEMPAGGAGRGGGAIRTRADVVRELERVCEWISRNEPSNPAPLLIRRAQRLMNMSFLEIVQDMAAAGMDQVHTIAGPQQES